MKKIFTALTIVVLLGIGGAAAFVYSGIFNFGADDPHSPLVYKAIETMRERSIAARLDSIKVPPLDDPQMLLAGGADYNDMCAGCHLKPGKTSSDIASGLYPQPPNLAMRAEDHHAAAGGEGGGHGELNTSAARQFWIIKHGIKGSGMAAFGPTHEDARIWAMVAFLQKLPTLDAMQYQILTARADGDMAGMKGMDHGDAPVKDAHAGMAMPPAAAEASTPQAAVDAFQAALQSGDAAAAERWLAADVLIFEGGGAERSRAEYASHHLKGDMAFMQQVEIEPLKRASGGNATDAWVMSESRIRGKSSKGKPVDVASTETALLRNTPEGWRIVHLHWSSRDYKPAP